MNPTDPKRNLMAFADVFLRCHVNERQSQQEADERVVRRLLPDAQVFAFKKYSLMHHHIRIESDSFNNFVSIHTRVSLKRVTSC